jgi:NADH dehydrogenase
VVVGGGFGGVFAARALEKALSTRAERVLLVAPENFFLFSPLLPEAASGTIEPRHAVIPLREILRRTHVLVGDVAELDLDERRLAVVDLNGDRHEIAYRSLIFSPGSIPTTRPIPGLLDHAVGFKTLADAIWLRNRVLHQLEAADATEDLALRRRMLTFTFVGGGYAGVEALAELESLARDALRAQWRVKRDDMRWVLVEAADTLLPGLDRRLSRYTEKVLRRRGVEVHLGCQLQSAVGGEIVLSDDRVAPYGSGTIVWTAGQRPSPLAKKVGFDVDERGRIVVDDHLRVPGRADVYAVGDVAAVPDPTGGLCPATAQHAMRQGSRAGKNVAADLGVGRAGAFTYKTRGLAVTLGKWQGTAQVRRLTFTGFLAWWMGRSYHLLMTPGVGRKVRIVADWTMSLLFPRDISQLGMLGRPSALDPPD